MRIVLTCTIAWVVSLILLISSGDYDLWIVPEPGHGEAWRKQRASPEGSVAWAVLGYSGLAIAATLLFHGLRGGARWLKGATRFQKTISIVAIVGAIGAVTGAAINGRSIRPTAEHQRIAEACRSLARSSSTLPDYVLQPEDPAIPQALRALNPTQVVVGAQNVIVFVSGTLREYHLLQDGGATNAWILYGALAGNGRHQEILRLYDR